MYYSIASRCLLIFLSVASLHADNLLHGYPEPIKVLHRLKQLEHDLESIDSSLLNDLEGSIRHMSDLDSLMRALVSEKSKPNRTVSETCSEQTAHFLSGLLNKNDPLAKLMFDAWGKPGSGIHQGELRWLGDYDECRNITARPANNSTDSANGYEGQYCSVGIGTGPSPLGAPSAVAVQLGVCMPSGCSSKDVLSIFQSLVDNVNTNISNTLSAYCQPKEATYTTGAIAAIVVFSVFGGICLIATIYDYVFYHFLATQEDDDVSSAANGNIRQHSGDTALLIPSKVQPREHGPLGEFLMCFSYYTNGSKLLNTDHTEGNLGCIHGIRFISMTWVILGHSLVFSLASIKNVTVVLPWIKRFTFQAIYNATVSVDTFFVLSGVLSAYLLFKNLAKSSLSSSSFFKSVPIMYLHRYIRLTPAYGFMILFYTYLTLYLYDGPLKADLDVTDPNCVNNSWTNFLYVNNIVHVEHQCASWGWYLANDFQFFILTPFLVYIIYRFAVVGLVLKLVMIVTSCIVATVISVHYDLGVGLFGTRDPKHVDPQATEHEMFDYYFVPWTRYQSYGVGLLFGYFLWKLHGKPNMKIPFVLNLIFWALSATLCMLVVYGPYDIASQGHIASVTEAAAYNGWSRTAWSVGVGYVILACCLGQGGWIDEFLSWRGFIPLSRMTYSAYLVHPVVMVIFINGQQDVVAWNTLSYVSNFATFLTLAYAAAFVFSLTFESPFMLIDKKYLTGRLTRSKK